MNYKKVLRKLAMLNKKAYGGDMVGEGTSQYDRAPFYGIDPQWDDQDVLQDPERYKQLVKQLKWAIGAIRKPGTFYVEAGPATKIVFSKKKYNEGDNIDARIWADKVQKALKEKNKKDLRDLAEYGYAWYGTDKAEDIPEITPQLDVPEDTLPTISTGTKVALGATGGLAGAGLAALAWYISKKLKQ